MLNLISKSIVKIEWSISGFQIDIEYFKIKKSLLEKLKKQ